MALKDSIGAINNAADDMPLSMMESVHSQLNEMLHRLDYHLTGTGHMEGLNQLFVEAEVLRHALVTHMIYTQDEIKLVAQRIGAVG